MITDTHSPSLPVFAATRTGHAPWRWFVVVAAGLAVGVLTSFGQGLVDGAAGALVNSVSAWLVVPLAVGALFADRRRAALAGMACALLQLAGYDVTSALRGFGVSVSGLDLLWAVSALVGGPVFGVAGHLWRHAGPATRGIGPAALAAVFIAEGAWNYVHMLGRPVTGALWIGIGAAIALLGLRGARGWRWLVLTLPVGLLGELALTRILA